MSKKVLNINVGVLGHVDSGKTSLCKCISSISSTAAFDKNPQSQQRGITLDLGFSSFTLPLPKSFNSSDFDCVQYTLVDCPGHAGLIKTIIGGAQIIDLMILVIDVNKGIQTQTAECLVIGEITCDNMIVVLNKIDLIETALRDKTINKVQNKIGKVLAATKFANAPFVHVSALCDCPQGINELKSAILNVTNIPKRSKSGSFLFAVDHCFPIKGQGTVLTGTVLQGSIAVNNVVEIPALGVSKKVKSMQMFRKPVAEAMQGDRLGICVTQFDSKLFERGVVCAPGSGSVINRALIKLNLIKYFKQSIESKMKFHITIGYETLMAKVTMFKGLGEEINFDFDYEYLESCESSDANVFGLLEFEKSVFIVKNSLVIGSKLDSDINKNICRIAFWGRLLNSEDNLPRIYKWKSKTGFVDRIVNNNCVIVKNMFKKESALEKFIGLKVEFQNGQKGEICGSFGQSGKIKINLLDEIVKPEQFKSASVVLRFKKMLENPNEKIKQ